MRPALGTALVALGLAVTAGAQTIPVDIWASADSQNVGTPSWYGNSGLLLVPSAYIGPPNRLTGGLHRVETDSESQDILTVNTALLADLELGVARINNILAPGFDTQTYTDETIFNAKYRLDLGKWFSSPGAPEIAIGVWDASDQLNRAFYLVGSKRFSLGSGGTLSQFTLHAGFGDTEHNTGALDGLFGGVEFSPFPRAVVQAEYDAEDFNACLRYSPTNWLSIDAGVLDGNFGWGASAKTVF